MTRFNYDGSQYTIPENHINTNKTGLYVSYYSSLLGWWNVNLGGEIFHTYAKSKLTDYKDTEDNDWSGKLELTTSFMLNRQKSLALNVRFNHYLPYHEQMVRFLTCYICFLHILLNVYLSNGCVKPLKI